MGARAERVGEEVRAVIARALLTDASDPRLASICITAVHCTGDLRNARVFWNLVLPGQDPAEVEKAERALRSAASFLRRAVADNLRIRATPELVFVHDASIDRGRHMDKVIAGLDIPKES